MALSSLKQLFNKTPSTWKDIAPPGQKVHFIWNGLSVTSDVRDVCLDGSKDFEVYQWCNQAGICATIHMKLDGNSVWRIKDEGQRAVFILKWM